MRHYYFWIDRRSDSDLFTISIGFWHLIFVLDLLQFMPQSQCRSILEMTNHAYGMPQILQMESWRTNYSVLDLPLLRVCLFSSSNWNLFHDHLLLISILIQPPTSLIINLMIGVKFLILVHLCHVDTLLVLIDEYALFSVYISDGGSVLV